MVWVHPKMAKIVSSTTGALVGAGSLRPPNEAFYFLNCPRKIVIFPKENIYSQVRVYKHSKIST